MSTTINGTTGVSQVQDGVVTWADLVQTTMAMVLDVCWVCNKS